MSKKARRSLISVHACFLLPVAWGILAVPETLLVAKGGKPSKETVRFDVTTLDLSSDIEIIGVFGDFEVEDGEDGIITTATGCTVKLGPAEGRADKSQVIVNRPSPAIRMDFLADLECFEAGDIYGLGCGGTLVIRQAKNGLASIIYFFLAAGKDGEAVGYRVDGDAVIVADNGGSFPKGNSGYTVFVDNIQVSQDTGSKENACESSFPDAMAVIRLDRQ